MDCAMLSQDFVEGDSLGHQVGDYYVIHSQTAGVLNNIIRRLTDDDKQMRNYRRALSFSEIIKKDLIPILINSFENIEVFSSVIRLLVNLTIPVECLFPVDNLNVLTKTEVGRQALSELSNSLLQNKELFTDRRTTRGIMERLASYSGRGQGKVMSTDEVALTTNCLLFIRNILHVPDLKCSFQPAARKGRGQNQIMWNLFSQNLDKTILDLIAHRYSSAWCVSVVQLVALVYKDQHVITLQKMLQNVLENTSESSEDNESNTSNQYHEAGGHSSSCSPSSNDSSEQRSRNSSQPGSGLSSPELMHSPRHRRDSCGSLNVLPNNSPAPSISEPSSPMSTMPSSPYQNMPQEEAEEEKEKEATFVLPKPVRIYKRGENTSSGITSLASGSSGIDSEIFSAYDGGDQPPTKVYLSENGKGERVKIEMRVPEKMDFDHKRRTDKMLVPPSCPRRSGGKPGKNQLAKVNSSSDNSDITGIPKKSHTKSPKQVVVESDFGYVSQQQQQVDQHEQDGSSSSNDEEEQKPPRTNPVKPRSQGISKLTDDEKKERQRLKLLKTSRENRMRLKSMINHVPSDKDISELLKEFTVDFLHNGYSQLVKGLLDKLSKKGSELSMDKSHFLWLLTYFLKFASQLEIGLDQIGDVISFRILSYITYQGVELLETLEMSTRERNRDISGHIKRMHLVVTALREFIQTIVNYSEIKTLTASDRQHLKRLQVQSVYAKDIRQLLVLLLRSFNPGVQSLQYLSDLVVCNHMLLLDLESVSSGSEVVPSVDMTQHMAQFANPEMMRQYGRLLEDFPNNTPFLNDCIFTVMHHIAGDLKSPQSLYLPSILKSFSKIWEQGLQICEDWVDLIEFIIQKFIQTMGCSPHACAANMVKYLDYTEVVDQSGLTSFQTSQLFWHFTQVENTMDPVGSLIEIYKQTDNIHLSRLVVIQALLSHGVITHAQYMNFIYMKNLINNCKTEQEGSVKAEVGSEHCNSDGHITDTEESMETGQEKGRSEIQVLKDCLVSQERGALILWLQEVLLDACRVKMYPDDLLPEGSDAPQEPCSFYYNQAGQSIPLVPWNRFQYQGLQTEAFILMLHKLGFQLPADVGKVFPRIPHFWSADHTYSVAAKLGPIATSQLKFSVSELERISLAQESSTESPETFTDFDSMEEMYLLKDAVTPGRPVTSWADLAAASKSRALPSALMQRPRVPAFEEETCMDMD